MAIRILNNNYGGRVSISSRGLGGKFNYTADPVRLLLNDYPGAAAAYSLRKLNNAYAGSAIRVRRSSDSIEQDIGFTSGQLNAAALLSFCGANSGFITTWYDQSGNNRNAVQATTANQPRIVNAGVVETVNNKPAILTDGSDILSFTPVISVAGLTKTAFSVFKRRVINVNFHIYGPQGSYIADGANNRYYAQTDSYFLLSDAGVANINQVLKTDYTTPTFGNIYINNKTIFTSINLNPFPTTISNILAVDQTQWSDGHFQEIIIYANNQLTNIADINRNINIYYNIIPAYPIGWTGTGTALLDLYPTAATAYSLRNLSSTYLGPLIRVRRTSDNQEADIYGTSTGQLDTISLLAFCGAGSGYIIQWHDQSGNFRHVIQSDTANQPRIVNAGVLDTVNGKPAAFVDTTDTLTFTPVVNITGATRTTFSVFKRSASNVNFLVYGALSNYILGANSQYYMTADSFFIQSTLVDTTTNQTLLTGYTNNITASQYKNGTLLTSNVFSQAFTPQLSSLILGSSSGHLQESVVYLNDKTSNRTAIESNINSYYSIY
jgi:hypothetical protein